MKTNVVTLDSQTVGVLDISDEIFAVEPRADILHRMVLWQLAKRQVGSHFCKTRAEVNRTGKKLGRQKGSGGARHGSRKSGIFVGGGKAFGPRPRSHAHALPKKIRRLAMKSALSSRFGSENGIIVDQLTCANGKTSDLLRSLGALGVSDALIVGGHEIDEGFLRAVRNIIGIDVLPFQGINVYDILRHRKLVLTKEAVELLEARLK